MNINSNKIFSFLSPFMTISLISYCLSTIVLIYLPKMTHENINTTVSTMDFTRYNMFESFFSEVEKKPAKKEEEVPKKKAYSILSNLTLSAIYAKSDNKGWVVIQEKANAKTHILSENESFKEYTLTKIYNSYVLFIKDGQEYKLSINEGEKYLKYEVVTEVDPARNDWSEKLRIEGNNVKITRKYLNSYISDIDKIWKNISINEVMTDGKITGFRINSVTKNSVFDKLGLKQGDIIKSVNNIAMSNYQDAFNMYNKINTIKYFNMKIIRNNKEMELDYEID